MSNEEYIVEDDERYAMVSKGILVARDRTALREYQRQVEKKRNKENRKQNEINNLREDVESLKGDMNDIKSMLTQLLNHKDNQ